jgi:hypothetical protein
VYLPKDNRNYMGKVDLYEGDRIIRSSSSDFLVDKEEWNPESDFIKLYSLGIENMSGELKMSDFKVILKLIPHISYTTGMLGKRGLHNKIVPLEQKDMIRITDLSKRHLINSLERLVIEKVFCKVKVGRNFLYYANPFIFFRGKYINKTLISMFKNYKYK